MKVQTLRGVERVGFEVQLSSGYFFYILHIGLKGVYDRGFHWGNPGVKLPTSRIRHVAFPSLQGCVQLLGFPRDA